jgi:hypothetical protein
MPNPDEENQLSEVVSGTLASATTNDLENEKSNCGKQGYFALASLMAEKSMLGIFRRFGVLNNFVLLFHQAELVNLESELLNLIGCNKDSLNNLEGEVSLTKDWHHVADGENQRARIDQIRSVLKSYSGPLSRFSRAKLTWTDEHLYLQHQLITIDKPERNERHFIKNWIRGEDMGNVMLRGLDRRIWRKAPNYELVALDARKQEDDFTDLCSGAALRAYDKLFGVFLNKV